MILGELLNRRVFDSNADPVGWVIDVRLTARAEHGVGFVPAQVFGLIVSSRNRSSFLGYERDTAKAPWLIARLLRPRQQGTFLVLWDQLDLVAGEIHLKPGHTRYRATLPPDERRRGARRS